jgi:ASC-1-like (ASCH) protein
MKSRCGKMNLNGIYLENIMYTKRRQGQKNESPVETVKRYATLKELLHARRLEKERQDQKELEAAMELVKLKCYLC